MNTNCIRAYHQRKVSGGNGKEISQSCRLLGKMACGGALGIVAELHRAYPRTDLVKVQSGRRVLVFDVCHNDYRLIVAVHFDRQRVYILRFLTHAEYSKDRWKSEL
jgi:mRNA-degrading endonuclease HigB of HigAB toxin-antitoxin module